MENSLKNKIKYEYEQGTETPSSELWDKLESKLDAAEEINIAPKKSIKINYWKYAAVILGLVSLGIILQYNFNDNSAENNTPTITKVETPSKTETLATDSAQEVQKIEIQPKQNQEIVNNRNLEFVPTQNQKEIARNTEKLTSNPQKFIENKKEENKNPSNFIEIKSIEKPTIQQEEKKLVVNIPANVPSKKSSTQYVKADELLFGRELHKTQTLENLKSKNKLGVLDIENLKKPSSIKLLGFTIYSDSTKSN